MTESEKLAVHDRNLRVLEFSHRDALKSAEGPEHAEMEMGFIDALRWARTVCRDARVYELERAQRPEVPPAPEFTPEGDKARVEEIRAKLATGSPFTNLYTEVAWLLGAYERARAEAAASDAAMHAIARTDAEEDLEHRKIIDDAREALGEGWLAGGVTLAEGIRRKTARLEQLGDPPTRPMRPVAEVTTEGVTVSAEPTPEWGWYLEGECCTSGFASRSDAVADAVRNGHRDFLVGIMLDIVLEQHLDTDDLQELLQERVLDNLRLCEFRVYTPNDFLATRALDEWVREHLDADTKRYCDGDPVTAEEIATALSLAPCACRRGAACTYRFEPPGDPDTGHCQQCGTFMPDSPDIKPGDEHACPACGEVYTVGEPEDA